MRNVLLFFARYYSFFLFLAFEFIAIRLIFDNNHYQRSIFTNTLMGVNGGVSSSLDDISKYFGLEKKNKQVANYNAKLLNDVFKYKCQREEKRDTIRDTTLFQTYAFQAAKVINNSIHNKHNYLTIDKGSAQGIKPEMGVIGADGVIGVVTETTANFSRIISLLNKKLQISARLKNKNYIGTVSWDGNNPLYARMTEIAKHVPVAIGDTIITTGFSTLFPEGIMIGYVNKKDFQEGGNFYDIEVKLSTDFSRIDQVYIVDYLLKEERLLIEKEGNSE